VPRKCNRESSSNMALDTAALLVPIISHWYGDSGKKVAKSGLRRTRGGNEVYI